MGNFKTFYKQYIKIVEKLTYSKNKKYKHADVILKPKGNIKEEQSQANT